MNELPARVISQRLSEGNRAAAFIPELRGRVTPGRPRSERELRELDALVDLFLSGAIVPRKMVLRVKELELYDPVDGDWSQAFRSPGIRECELISHLRLSIFWFCGWLTVIRDSLKATS